MKTRKLLHLIFGAFLVLLIMTACGTSPTSEVPPAPTPVPPTSTPEQTGITITGVIINITDAEEQYLAEDSYLQLVSLPPDGQLGFTTDDQGRLAYNSELVQIPIPPDGAFLFNVANLDPGTYLIAAQLLRGSSFMMPLLESNDELVRIEISQDITLPQTINLGDVTIPLP